MIELHSFSFSQGATAPNQPYALVFSGVGRVHLNCNGRLATSIAGLTSAGPVDYTFFGPGAITLDIKEPVDIYACAADPTNTGSNCSCTVISGDFGEGLVP